jgi:MFS family permease
MAHFEGAESVLHDTAVKDDFMMSILGSKKKPFQETKVKYFGLFLICMNCFGLFYCYGNPQSLQPNFYSLMKISPLEYSLLIAMYAYPNFVVPILGGFLSDKIGIKTTYYISSGLVVGGQLLFWFGCTSLDFITTLIGRFLFGVGGGTLNLIRYPMMCKWFDNKELGFAYGLTLTSVRIASVANSLISPNVAESTNSMSLASFIGLMTCVVSFFCGALWVKLDEISDKRIKVLQTSEENEKSMEIEVTEVENDIKWTDLLKFGKMTWLFALISMFSFSIFISFLNVANYYLQIKYNISQGDAGDMLSIFYLTTGVFTPLFGYLSDKKGKKLNLLIISNIILISSLLGFLYIPDCAYCYNGLIPLMILAVYVALLSGSYWPCVVELEDKKYIGLLNGFIAIAYNVGEGIFPVVIGYIQEHNTDVLSGYFWSIMFLLGTGFLGLILVIIAKVWDKRDKRTLNN